MWAGTYLGGPFPVDSLNTGRRKWACKFMPPCPPQGEVQRVIDRYVGEISMLDSGDVIRVDQAQLETVIPSPGGSVLVSAAPPRRLPVLVIAGVLWYLFLLHLVVGVEWHVQGQPWHSAQYRHGPLSGPCQLNRRARQGQGGVAGVRGHQQAGMRGGTERCHFIDRGQGESGLASSNSRNRITAGTSGQLTHTLLPLL